MFKMPQAKKREGNKETQDMVRLPKCKLCSKEGHYRYQCYQNKKKPIKQVGKVAKKWGEVRNKWFMENPRSFYNCYICQKRLMPSETTLDHVIPRSRRPDLRYKFSNLKPCCYQCNMEKGSK